MPDVKNICKIKGILDKILETEPTAEELDYDDAAVGMYSRMSNLKDAIERYGLDGIEPIECKGIRPEWMRRSLTINDEDFQNLVKSIFGEHAQANYDYEDGSIFVDQEPGYAGSETNCISGYELSDRIAAHIGTDPSTTSLRMIAGEEYAVVIIMYKDPYDEP